jgi:Ni2+-binding GTPase involved in maturation of urease and hydrogenase
VGLSQPRLTKLVTLIDPHDLSLMRKEADDVRGGRPVVGISARSGEGIDAVMDVLEREVLFG